MSELPLPPATRTLGASGIEVSPIAWGMWRLTENGRTVAEAAKLVHAALDAGITFLDTADIYGFDGSAGFGDAEALLGEVLAAEPGLRGKMVLATKGGFPFRQIALVVPVLKYLRVLEVVLERAADALGAVELKQVLALRAGRRFAKQEQH